MNRFDSFLKYSLVSYLQYLKDGIISEIVICDETGDDYNKIMATFGPIQNMKVIKNECVLGVFKNKLKVASIATSNYVALIDSDNFCDATYFTTVKNYIVKNESSFSSAVVLVPSFAKPNFSFKQFENTIVTKANVSSLYNVGNFSIALNVGNHVINKKVINNIRYDESVMFYITAADVLYFNLLAFLQFDDFELHIVKDLEYEHSTHSGSIYINTIQNCSAFINSVIIPAYNNLSS